MLRKVLGRKFARNYFQTFMLLMTATKFRLPAIALSAIFLIGGDVPDYSAYNRGSTVVKEHCVRVKRAGKEVIRKWTNMRDSFLKYRKKIKASKSSGSGALQYKKYIYSDQLQFLCKVCDERDTVDSMGPIQTQDGEEAESMNVQDFTENSSASASSETKKKKTKGKPLDEFEVRILKAVEGEKPCGKMAFLQSLMHHLKKFNDEDFLQFQLGSLKLIENINEKRKVQDSSLIDFSQNQNSIYFPIPIASSDADSVDSDTSETDHV
ncbi:uncharacterized protein LOC129766540 [Toxorhynchites rutilus septentrionalis]|uniref:uncharacterized protein LOC129766540 n=1 Tax=Toxorhynchites rutilus septentrionalis TaxID=329112 RepID=UPI0024791913|nr:uncharacterized protein LOC129766540 [Toxorhynchites rutilus septentrionalis]